MLAVKNYPIEYINDCRSRLETQLSTYQELLDTLHGKSDKRDDIIAAFETNFYNNLLLALEGYFCHRTRGIEGKDGNPLNEVRLLAASIMQHQGKMTIDKTINYKPGSAVLGYKEGEDIRLTKEGFASLSEQFLSEIKAKYT